MKQFIVLAFLSSQALAIERLPPQADDSRNYTKMRQAIAHIESGGNPAAKNPVTSASGKYQFMKVWDRYFKRELGRTWNSTIPTRKASRAEKIAASRAQDRMFDFYYNTKVSPWLQRIRESKKAKRYSDSDLVAIYHRQGELGADIFLKSGHDPWVGRFGNTTIALHLKRMRRAMNELYAIN